MTDRTILVVGATQGIGLELAKDIVARGDRVVITGRGSRGPPRSPRHRRRAPPASPSTSRSPRRSRRSWRASVTSTGSCSRRSNAMRTPSATTTSHAPAGS